MPDILNYSVTVLGAANVNVPRATIAARVVDSSNQSIVLADFTGGNALNWPGVLTTLTATQRQQLIDMVATTIILMRAGLA